MVRIRSVFESGKGIELLKDIREVSSTIGREVEVRTIEDTFEGTVQTIGESGQLLVRLKDGGTVEFYAGDVIHLHSATAGPS